MKSIHLLNSICSTIKFQTAFVTYQSTCTSISSSSSPTFSEHAKKISSTAERTIAWIASWLHFRTRIPLTRISFNNSPWNTIKWPSRGDVINWNPNFPDFVRENLISLSICSVVLISELELNRSRLYPTETIHSLWILGPLVTKETNICWPQLEKYRPAEILHEILSIETNVLKITLNFWNTFLLEKLNKVPIFFIRRKKY